MTEQADVEMEAKLRSGFSQPPQPDFETWLSNHRESVAYLSPTVTANYVRRRHFVLRLTSAAIAATVILLAGLWVLTPQKRAFAKTFEAIQQAKTISWSIDWYDRLYSVDGQRSWIKRAPRWERSYLAPNKWRDVRYADDGTVAHVAIEDTQTGEVLSLDMKKRTATLTKEPSGQFGSSGPFASIESILRGESLVFHGQHTIDGRPANVFRHHRELRDGNGESMEIWIDAQSKRLLKYTTTPGSVYFDPETVPDRNNVAEEKFSKGTIAGVVKRDIVFDAQLDPSLFSLTPPAGFERVDPPPRVLVSEELMIQWLGLSAAANGGVFLELERGFNMKWHNVIANKPKQDRTEAEQKYMEVAYKHILDGNMVPIEKFYETFTEPNSFRYLGQAGKLGDKDRLVCFYKLKSTGHYRAVYGDLSVKDISAQELPLPVE